MTLLVPKIKDKYRWGTREDLRPTLCHSLNGTEGSLSWTKNICL